MHVPLPLAYRCAAVKQRHLNEDFTSDGTIRFADITGNAMKKVLSYCKYELEPTTLVDLPTPPDCDMIEPPTVPFATYLTTANSVTLCELASASFYMDVKPLVEITCRAIANTIKGKSPGEQTYVITANGNIIERNVLVHIVLRYLVLMSF